jgi:hypothetical protein
MTIMNVTSTRLVARPLLDTSGNDFSVTYTSFADNAARHVDHLTYTDAMERAALLRRRGYSALVRKSRLFG